MSGPASIEHEGTSSSSDGSDLDAERTAGLVDPERLGAWMDRVGLPGEGEPLSSRFITGGASNEIFEVNRRGPLPDGLRGRLVADQRARLARAVLPKLRPLCQEGAPAPEE